MLITASVGVDATVADLLAMLNDLRRRGEGQVEVAASLAARLDG